MKIIFQLIFIFASGILTAQNVSDTVSANWDSNDPNCPCYKIQKQAEKEYAGILAQEKKNRTPATKNNIKKRTKRNGKHGRKVECPNI